MAATILASEIATKAGDVLSDAGATRWPNAEILRWINDGCREVAIAVPEASSKTANLLLAAGTKQVTPIDNLLLMRVNRNMGNGTTPGEAPRRVKMELLDLQRPTWHTDTPTVVVKNWSYDSKLQNTFYVWPPQTGGTYLEIVYCAQPATVTALANTISIDDQYANMLLDYVLYRAFLKDTELAGMAARAQAHLTAFQIGIKIADPPEGSA